MIQRMNAHGAFLRPLTESPQSLTAVPRVLSPLSQARGPLAQAVLRVLGIGPPGQAWASWSQPALGQAFGRQGDAVATAWLAARALPTPNGFYRAQAGPVWKA